MALGWLRWGGQVAIGVLPGAALWTAGRPVLAAAVFGLVSFGLPLLHWWTARPDGRHRPGRGPAAQVERDERTLAGHEELLGPLHPQTLTARNNLAVSYLAAGRVGEAVGEYERALTYAVHVEGADHPETLIIRRNLAAAYLRAGRPGDAVALLRRAQAAAHATLGERHPESRGLARQLSRAVAALGRRRALQAGATSSWVVARSR
ncbi:tetratricopeptide repeat protein [Allonocardiopsis opalescens]|uniref:Tetratricopeptide repeat protein n=1 Tax=Allonocardiopsis opalescens TaxID=1144618 RepID=A0A2T0PUB4_9ACTN|nr:tetratricopeptide repeat protein [Allonocardiopsis opalescens]PRX92388.1 tetratricopeptide repeat protein [Allonocardiopsis opalescens]